MQVYSLTSIPLFFYNPRYLEVTSNTPSSISVKTIFETASNHRAHLVH